MTQMKRREYRYRLKNQEKVSKHMNSGYTPPFKRKERKILNESEGIETRSKARNRKRRFK